MKRVLQNTLISVLILGCAIGLSLLFFSTTQDNNPFTTPLFILAVALIARFTNGYAYGIIASVLSVLCVNYIFTYPFFEFNMTLSGYPLTIASMLIVSVIISALTTQTKRQEKLRYDIEAEKMRANLLRSVSHDLRTPLASIMGASSAMLENADLSEADRVSLLSEISKDAQWLIRITENILSITRCSGDNVTLRKEEEVLEEIVGSAIVKFKENHPEMSIRVSRPEEILLVPMDAMLIEQVIINLFENVTAHASGADRICVAFRRSGENALISVQDNGRGFSAQSLPHLFDGTLLHGDKNGNEHRNMGIGLSVCRSILLAHGGDISARNTAEGACVDFWLPCEENEENEF